MIGHIPTATRTLVIAILLGAVLFPAPVSGFGQERIQAIPPIIGPPQALITGGGLLGTTCTGTHAFVPVNAGGAPDPEAQIPPLVAAFLIALIFFAADQALTEYRNLDHDLGVLTWSYQCTAPTGGQHLWGTGYGGLVRRVVGEARAPGAPGAPPQWSEAGTVTDCEYLGGPLQPGCSAPVLWTNPIPSKTPKTNGGDAFPYGDNLPPASGDVCTSPRVRMANHFQVEIPQGLPNLFPSAFAVPAEKQFCEYGVPITWNPAPNTETIEQLLDYAGI